MMVDKLKSMNGWNRLFVLVSLLWLIIVILIGVKESGFTPSNDEVNQYLPKEYQTPTFDPDKYLENHNKDDSFKRGEWEVVPPEDLPVPIPPDVYHKAYERAHFHQFIDVVWRCLGFFFFPLIVLYFFSWMIGWVIRGFINKN